MDSQQPEEHQTAISKKAANKEAEKLRRKQEHAVSMDESDPLASNYGDLSLHEIETKETVTETPTMVKALTDELKDSTVWIQGRVLNIRAVSKKLAFVVVHEHRYTVQCVLMVKPGVVSSQMVKFVTSLPRESYVDVEGIVSVPENPLKATTQQVEIQVCKFHCISRARATLPFSIEDASRSEDEINRSHEEGGEKFVRVLQDTRLNNRVLDLRTSANQAIFDIAWQVQKIFMQVLDSMGFVGIHTPKLIAGSSEGGSAVFTLNYKGQPACLAQSPQLHKQMAISGGRERVFTVGSVFRAEDSFTHRHLCEFIGLDVETKIIKHYSEVMDIVDHLFVAIFDHLNENCREDLGAVGKQYPFEPLKYLRKTLRLTFKEGVQMLKEAGLEVDPLGDLNTEAERRLGQLVLDKYGTEFYILHRYPLAVRPFYTMPCSDDGAYSNSFDVFIRGEEIISGGQRVHVPELLVERAQACGINVKTISSYIDSFRDATPPHGGFGVGLERVVMLFCNLENIRMTSLFPRDPRRINP